jgi:hypothetical protein
MVTSSGLARAQWWRETTGRWIASGQHWPDASGQYFSALDAYWTWTNAECLRVRSLEHHVRSLGWLDADRFVTVGIKQVIFKMGHVDTDQRPDDGRRVSGQTDLCIGRLGLSPFLEPTALLFEGAYKYVVAGSKLSLLVILTSLTSLWAEQTPSHSSLLLVCKSKVRLSDSKCICLSDCI